MIVFIVHNLPHTFVVVALLIVLLGAVTIVRTPTDIFPDVAIPVASVIWVLTGTPVDDMEALGTTTERALTTSVNDIGHGTPPSPGRRQLRRRVRHEPRRRERRARQRRRAPGERDRRGGRTWPRTRRT